jgi:hypothetical protein
MTTSIEFDGPRGMRRRRDVSPSRLRAVIFARRIRSPGRPFPALAAGEGLELVGREILPPRAHGAEITLLRLRRPLRAAT